MKSSSMRRIRRGSWSDGRSDENDAGYGVGGGGGTKVMNEGASITAERGDSCEADTPDAAVVIREPPVMYNTNEVNLGGIADPSMVFLAKFAGSRM
jgi:hypothetical protein